MTNSDATARDPELVGGFGLLEVSIAGVLDAFASGAVTPSALVAAYLARVERYDAGPEGLNAIPVLNPDALAQAAESDRRWAADRRACWRGYRSR